jgi:hypothetical protein
VNRLAVAHHDDDEQHDDGDRRQQVECLRPDARCSSNDEDLSVAYKVERSHRREHR